MTATNPLNRGSCDIAVVGVSALFPGSTDATGFWSDILANRDLLTEVPASHWLIEDYYDPDPTKPDKTYAKRGGFLPSVDFDALSWGVPPSILPATDTAQLLALIVAQKVLEDAWGSDFMSMDKSRMSCILGVTSAQELLNAMVSRLQRPHWIKGMREAGLPEEEVQAAADRISANYAPWQEATFPGLLGNVVAGRIANRLDLGGTNCVTDAACASTFSALHMAVNELVLGDSDVVIAGGVDTMNDIFMYMCFSKTPALSASGDCRPFSDKADGTMLGEGMAMVALKRLADAERDGDQVYAVIKAVGSSSDGRSKSVYAPISAGQARSIRRSYERAGFGAETVELVEAHGTGTRAGDAAEFGGLRMVYEESERKDPQWCALGTVKSQIGHTKAAAGAAGLFKAIMALHHKVLPPTAKVDKPDPKLDIESSPFYLNTRTRPWIRGADHPRRAGVSSFGFGGSNFHVALEEYQGEHKAGRLRSWGWELVTLTANSAKELEAKAKALSASAADLRWEAWKSANEPQQGSHRLAVAVSSLSELKARLLRAAERVAAGQTGSTPDGIHYGHGDSEGQLAFLFPGQGSQYPDMGAQAVVHLDAARAAWDLAADLELGEEPLQHIVFPKSAFSDQERQDWFFRLKRTEHAQPAIGVTSLALLGVARSLGLHPDHVAGHSFGEVMALHAAGAFTAEDALRVARQRGLRMAEAAVKDGSMSAVSAPIEKVRALLSAWGETGVVVANHNHPGQVVLSGGTEAIAAVEARLQAEGLAAQRLEVATAFHSSIVSDSVGPFGEFLSGVQATAPTLPVWSNALAAPYPAEVRTVLAEQLAEPVRFVEMIEGMYAAGVRTFLEVGPGSVLTRLVGRILGERPHLALSMDRNGRDGLHQLLDTVGALFAAGQPVQCLALWEGYKQPVDPASLPKPKLAVAINGTNVGKPYPPKEGAAGRPGPNPPRVVEVIEKPVDRIVEKIVEKIVEVPVERVVEVQSTVHSGASMQSPPRDANWLSAFSEVQRQTADAHSAFQAAMVRSHEAFLKTAETSIMGLASLGGGFAQQAPVHAAPAPVHAAPTPAYVAQAPAYVAPAPAYVAPAPAPVVAPVVAAPAPAPAPAPAIAPVAKPVVKPAADIEAVMMGVVADKTGYPAEMLTLSMDMEGDLGIDSIKRVEILSAVKEKVPGLPEVDPAALGRLRTLGEVVDHMRGSMPAASVSAPVAVAAPSADIEAVMMGVVADKTGYPAEMLTLSMDMEGDLGIDSLKRVEILSAVKEKVPGLPEVDPAALGRLRTLGEVVDHMRGSMPSVAVAAVAPSADIEAVMMGVVAEKTGYPAEMLSLSMDMEGDLGIDSIKRVEILSAVKEKVPGLPEVDPAALGRLRTLGEVVDHMRGSMPSVAVAAVAPSADIEAVMMAVVAEKTGYPAEMLSLSMDMEGDLGIDSIKRVEILSGVKDRVPGLPEVDPAALGRLRTLGEVVEHMRGSAPALAAAPAPAPAPVAASPVAASPVLATKLPALGRYAREALPTPASGMVRAALPAGASLVVCGGPVGLRRALAQALESRGQPAQAVDALPEASTQGLVLLAGLEEASPDAAALSAFRAARAVAPVMAERGGLFVVVQDTGGRFGLSELSAESAWRGGGAALARTAAQEWPKAAVKAIDLQRGARAEAELASALAEEILSGGPELEVGLLEDGGRISLIDAAAPLSGGSCVLDQSDIVLVTGGARGVTAATMIALAAQTRAGFVLLGRTALEEEPAGVAAIADEAGLKRALLAGQKGVTPAELSKQVGRILANREIRTTLAAIQAAGGRARYEPTDVTDPLALRETLGRVQSDWGAVTALVHGAGVLADKRIEDKTDEQFQRVFSTKVDSLALLLEALAQAPLKAIVLFSSVAARCGNQGQVDYAMANEVLNQVAQVQAQARPGCRVRSIGWGPWEGGMVTPALKARFEAMGVPVIPLAAGAKMLVDELSGADDGNVVVVIGGAPRVGQPLAAEGARELELNLRVRRDSHPYLADHAIQGTPVVPVVLVVEWFARAARAFRPDLKLVGVQDIKVLSGVKLSHFDNGGDSLRLSVRQISNGSGVSLALELRGPDGRRHYSATAQLADRLPVGAGAPTHTLPAWDGPVYGGVLFHGPDFQVIADVEGVSKEGGAATMRGVRQSGWRDEGWATDVAAMDGGLQLALLWTQEVLGGKSLPTGVGALRLASEAPSEGLVRCVLTGRRASGSKTVSDLIFVDSAGRTVAELDAVETHLLPQA